MVLFKKAAAVSLPIMLAMALLAGCGSSNASSSAIGSSASSADASISPTSSAITSSSADSSSGAEDSVVYQNDQYGFTFTLPEDWKGYSIVTEQWEGLSSTENGSGEVVTETGPQITLRDPRWTDAQKRQDIPIMVFTLDQWNNLQQDQFHIGAAPIGPSELGRNNKYVFGLPARYNFSFYDGYEEVESILEGQPLQTSQLS